MSVPPLPAKQTSAPVNPTVCPQLTASPAGEQPTTRCGPHQAPCGHYNLRVFQHRKGCHPQTFWQVPWGALFLLTMAAATLRLAPPSPFSLPRWSHHCPSPQLLIADILGNTPIQEPPNILNNSVYPEMFQISERYRDWRDKHPCVQDPTLSNYLLTPNLPTP